MAKTIEELERDVEHWRGEARQAFRDRDEIKERLRSLEGNVLSADDRKLFEKLRADQKKIEEDKAKAEGNYEQLRAELEKAHTEKLTAEQTARAQLQARLHAAHRQALFGSAIDLFGGRDARTIFDAETAIKVLGDHVKIDDDGAGFKVTITGPDGKAIEGKDFSDRMSKLVEALPNRDRILRGGGKPGSGSSGSGDGTRTTTADLSHLSAADFRDPSVRAAVQQKHNAAGTLQFGSAFDQINASRAKK